MMCVKLLCNNIDIHYYTWPVDAFLFFFLSLIVVYSWYNVEKLDKYFFYLDKDTNTTNISLEVQTKDD